MLTLQRASAGSGKTYTLAGRYIWFYITIAPEREDGGFDKRRLRTDAELRDSLSHILAITFTNKATNEMQMRIIDKLNELAQYDPTAENLPDYMEQFCNDLCCAPDAVSNVCKKALRLLLDNYSDFNVSTIDSFFQRVLRTFAYETDLADSFQVELDSDMLSKVGINATLDEVERDIQSPSTFWIRQIMDNDDSHNWDLFQKKEKAGQYGTTPYGILIENINKLENEEYKNIRREVEEYFANGSNYKNFYQYLTNKYTLEAWKLSNDVLRNARKLIDLLPAEMYKLNHNHSVGFFANAAKNILKGSKGWSKIILKGCDDLENKKTAKQFFEKYPQIKTDIIPAYNELNKSFNAYEAFVDPPEYKLWKLYETNLPFLGLLEAVTQHRQEYLDENNSIELAETSSILGEIIGDDDAPFIYERLGMLLNHFLIDEFQDTSRMQWQNLAPLLNESMSRGNDNLIIGDAKQSIYRFRNADSSLITEVVPRLYGDSIINLGDAPKENTNHRSQLRIVQFNNSLFSYIIDRIPKTFTTPEGTERLNFADIYSNVVQTPKKRKAAGYIEARFYNRTRAMITECISAEIPQLVVSLLQRGHKMGDIAILVRTGADGTAVVNSFLRYNNEAAPEEPRIEFVSEDSLLISSAPAVQLIVAVLTAVAHGTNQEQRDEETRLKKGVGQWNDLAYNFQFYLLGHEGKPTAELLDDFLKEGDCANRLSEMLSDMQTTAIPAIVEAAIATFLPAKMREHDAVFISAFQDLVMEYCESHPTDIGSFLTWWQAKSKKASIASPEGLNAVQVLTIHKSKGLQYPCVIVPFNEWDLYDKIGQHHEWRWVKPVNQFGEDLPVQLPPYIPIEVTTDLKGTPHEPLIYSYYDAVKSDYLNAAYVAYTRAESELYILAASKRATPLTKPDGKPTGESSLKMSIGDFIYDFLQSEMENADTDDIKLLPGSCVSMDEEDIFKVGTLPEIEENKEEKDSGILLTEYLSTKAPNNLKYRLQTLPDVIDPEEYEEDKDRDPRSEGNIKHAIFELTECEEDLPRAVRAIQSKGLMSNDLAAKYQADLEEALQFVKGRGWFDGTKRVITERPLLRKNSVPRRPDRIMIDDQGNATIVDFKFGKADRNQSYVKQVKRYITLLKQTGQYKSVKGAIWYVNRSNVPEVPDIVEI